MTAVYEDTVRRPSRQSVCTALPRMNIVSRAVLRIAAPFVLGVMSLQSLAPWRSLVRTCRVPRRVLWRTYFVGASARRETAHAVANPRRVCVELGLVGPIAHLD